MPIIRVEIQKFVKTWNSHPIRRQKNRPECIAGQPVDLYHWPPDGTQEYGLPVDEELLHHLQQISNPWGKFGFHRRRQVSNLLDARRQ